ncbi:MAG: hypothetical protein NTZ23_03195 [Cyanobium sp. LacPavin_0920_WC12_MAG_63_22]|nr:hypothetical protein [Cyanobium sp. LacPavin_0920_WC12_MAG_63_22]
MPVDTHRSGHGSAQLHGLADVARRVEAARPRCPRPLLGAGRAGEDGIAPAIAVVDADAVAPGDPAPLLKKLVGAQLAAAAHGHPIGARGADGLTIGAEAHVEKVVGVVHQCPDAFVALALLLLFGGEGAMGWWFCGLQGAWGCGDQQEQEG